MGNDGLDRQFRVRSSVVYLVFALSGASALVYQIIWARWLGLVFGNTTLSISIVLGSFMLGLAVGSWIAGGALQSIDNPMRSYALLELGIGTFALCFPWLTKLADSLLSSLVSSESLTGYGLAVRAVLSTGILLLPTSLMGATLPLLTDFFHRSPKHTQNWKVGLLYAANTLGAAAGILFASFIFIELVGVLETNLIAAGMNFLVAFLAFRMSSSLGSLPEKVEPALVGKVNPWGKFAIALVTASGFLALASEVLWTRTQETIVGNSTYAFASIVLVYLVGISAGSWVMSLWVNRLSRLPVWMGAMFLGMGLWELIAISLFEGIAGSLASYSAQILPLSMIFGHYLRAMGVLLPLALLSGACFPLATRMIDPRSEDAKGALVAKACAWNTMGALLGSSAAGFLIAPFWDFLSALYLLGSLYCLVAAVSFGILASIALKHRDKLPVNLSLGVLSAALLVFSLIRSQDASYFLAHVEARNPDYNLVFHQPGLQGVTSVLLNPSQRNGARLLVNGLGMTAKITDTKIMAHLPMLLHPNPDDTLVICFGMGTTFRSAVSYGKNVTVVELVKEVVEAFNYFHEDAPAVRAYAGGRIVVNDGRNFLNITQKKFDVITVDPPPPIDAAGVNNLYSKEFIELAREHLKKGGIMAHWIPFPGRGGVDDLETHLLLVRTFAQVFPYTYLHSSIDGVGLHVLGSMDPIAISADQIRNKLSNTPVKNDLNEWEQVPFEFFVKGWMLPPESAGMPSITDNEPHLEFYLLRTLRTGGKKMHPKEWIW